MSIRIKQAPVAERSAAGLEQHGEAGDDDEHGPHGMPAPLEEEDAHNEGEREHADERIAHLGREFSAACLPMSLQTTERRKQWNQQKESPPIAPEIDEFKITREKNAAENDQSKSAPNEIAAFGIRVRRVHLFFLWHEREQNCKQCTETSAIPQEGVITFSFPNSVWERERHPSGDKPLEFN